MNVAVNAVDHLPRLSLELINDMHTFIKKFRSLTTAISEAKQRWPQYQFILCSELDMGERDAFQVCKGFSFFLVSADLGCASLTFDPEKSVGLVIAEHETDE